MIDLVHTLLKNNKTVGDKVNVLYQIFTTVIYMMIYYTVGGSITLSNCVLYLAGPTVYARFYASWCIIPLCIISGVYIIDYTNHRPHYKRRPNVYSNSLVILKLLLQLIVAYECSHLVVLNTGYQIIILLPCRNPTIIQSGVYIKLSHLYAHTRLRKYLHFIQYSKSLVWTSADVHYTRIIAKVRGIFFVYSRSLMGKLLHIYTITAEQLYIGKYTALCKWYCPKICANPSLVNRLSMFVYSYHFLVSGVAIKDTITTTNIQKNKSHR